MPADVPESYIPPKWGDITPLLFYSAIMWGILFLVALVREVTELLLTSRVRRDSKARASTNIFAKCVMLFSQLYKRLRLALLRGRIPELDLIWNVRLPRCIVGACVCAFYCINTHTKSVTPAFYFVQVLYGLVVLLCVVYDFVYEPGPILYMFRPGVIVECLTVPSLLLAANGLWLNLNFLQAYSILTLWYILEQHEIVLRNANSLTRLYANISLEMATFVFITACGVHFFELLGDPGTVAQKMFQITWANSLYFAVVTLMTVGYGDFVPYSFVGRLWIVVHIIRAAYLVVREMDAFFKSEARQRRGIETYIETMESSHVVVTGHVKWEYLKQLVEEFLKVSGNDNNKVVVLTSSPTWSSQDWDKFISRDVFYDYRVFYVDGSPLEHYDLERARVVSARAVFVLSDPHRGDPYHEDAGCLKTILSIRKYGGNVPIFTFNISENSSPQFGIAMERIDDELSQDMHNWDPPSVRREDVRILDDLDSAAFYSASVEEERAAVNQAPSSRLFGLSSSHIFQDTENENDELLVNERNRNGESLCTQELELALLAENVYCNGLSTLLANLTLRFAPIPKPKDRSWLMEYKLGAQCCIEWFKIPDKLDGRTYKSVATLLQDYGIVILSVVDKDKRWKIITVDTVLERQTNSMIITYHSRNVIPWIMERVYLQLDPITSIDDTGTSPHSDRFPSGDQSYRTHSYAPERRNSITDSYELTRSQSRDPPSSLVDRTFLPSTSRSRVLPIPQESRYLEGNLDSRDIFSGDDVTESRADTRRMRSRNEEYSGDAATVPSDAPAPFFTQGGLPTTIDSGAEDRLPRSSSASISALDEDERVRRQKKENVRFERKLHPPRFYSSLHPIPDTLSNHVIVCLDGEHSLTSLKMLLKNIWKRRKDQALRTKVVVIHPNFPKNFDREIQCSGDDLFLLRGHSLSVMTLDLAQYSRSRAMLILTSENRGEDSTRNTDSKAIFTVMTLDSLLDRARIYVCCMLDAEDSLRLMRAPKHSRQIAFNREDSDCFSIGSIKRSMSGTMLSGMYGMNYGTMGPNQALGRDSSQANPFLSRGSNLAGTLADEQSSEEDELFSKLSNESRRSGNHRSEGELCERQRYASGEMIISSLYAALLVREESQPGFIKVIRGLLGLGDSSSTDKLSEPDENGTWIRLLQIPEYWTTSALTHSRNFRETSLHLQQLGCVAIGLCRSGRAPVRYMKSGKEGSFQRQMEGVFYDRDPEQQSLLSSAQASTLRFSLHSAFRGGAASNADASPDSTNNPNVNFERESNHSYKCPSTGRIIEYLERACDNVLPYVYCFPEPYTVVDASDGVFVLCDPELSVPTDWNLGSDDTAQSQAQNQAQSQDLGDSEGSL